MPVPSYIEDWFDEKGWSLRRYQRQMVNAWQRRTSTLLIAPTGAGKTLSGFLPSLIDIHERDIEGLHTLYVSPLKALTNDIQRNLTTPIDEMALNVTVESRTGDTPSSKRQRQRRKPPNILLTTPESLMLMLSYADAPRIFGKLKAVIIDEAHSFAHTKRGDFTALAMARLRTLAPQHIRIGLSATVAYPDLLAAWLGPTGEPAKVLAVASKTKPRIRLLKSKERLPFGGFMARYAIKDIYKAVSEASTSLVFVNTRAQAELLFQYLWEHNVEGLPIAIYHGSLSKEQRRKTEAMMASGQLRAIVTTSALELGIDWGNVELVIQVGAPKGVSRLLQRIGRSNHRMDEPSQALLVPANRFEALECMAAMRAISDGQLDGEQPGPGALDVVPQFIVNCLCSQADSPDAIYQQVLDAAPYSGCERDTFDRLWQFTVDGGYALQAYERFQRIEQVEEGIYQVTSKVVMQRHRQNVGTIVEAGRLRVKRLRRAHQGKIIGDVEEYFAQQLVPGDTFLFAGEVLAFDGIRDMLVEAWPGKGGEPKIPSYVGGQMPMSTFLAEGVKALLAAPGDWKRLPLQVREWLDLQKAFSQLPTSDTLLVEQFPYRNSQYTLFYSFEGRKANQTLGMLITKRMEKMGLKPVSFSITDYGLSVSSILPVEAHHIDSLVSPDILGDELEDWMLEAPMLKRSFRHVAIVSGLIEQNYYSNKKTMKQVTFSTDLIYDVLREHDPEHVLLRVTREDAERELLDLKRLADMLIRYVGKSRYQKLERISPMAIPIVLDVRSEQLRGAGIEAIMEQASLQDEAELLIEEIRQELNATS